MLMKRILFIAMLGGIGFTTVQCTKTIEERVEVIRERGNAILSGNGIPDASLGKVGDYYLDLSGVNLYGAKTAEGWGNPISLRGLKGDKGNDGQNGTDAPVPNIKGGYWYIGETNTGIKAEGKDGTNGSNGSNGTNGKDGKDGKDGINPADGYWVVNGQKTNIKAKGTDGTNGQNGSNGTNGKDGKDGKDGVTPTITINSEGYWVINGQTSTTKAKAETPHIGSNGNWFIGTQDTNIKAQGPKGDTGATGAQGDRGERGLPGKDGSVIYADKGKPTTQGKDGDYYIDTEAKIFYGPKANNTWPTTGISLTGKNINTTDYELSADGKTLKKWNNAKTHFIDMNTDPNLKEVETIATLAFDGGKVPYELRTFVIGNKVKNIEAKAFNGCLKLTTVEIDENAKSEITEIKEQTFANCNHLQNIDIPSSVTTIKTRAFAGCYKLTTVILPEKVNKIDNNAFMKCKNLHTVIIHNPTAFTIGAMAFNQANLRNIYVPNGTADTYKAANPTYKDIIR